MKEQIRIKEWIKKRQVRIKGSSLKTYRSYENAYILPILGNDYLTEITQKKIRKFQRYLKKRLSTKTVHDILSYLKTILKFAKAKGYAVNSLKMPNTKVITEEKEIFNEGEQKDLSGVLKESNDPRDIGVLMGLSTGIRLGEVLGLSVKDIDLEASVIRVRKNAQRIYDPKTNTYPVVIQSLKTKASRRDIPIHKELLEVLTRFIKSQNYTSKDSPLIAAPSGKPYDARTLQRRFNKCRDALGLNQKTTFHSTRHSFATRALELGAEMNTVSSILGHSSVGFTLKCYGHSVTAQKREQMNKIAKSF